MNLSTLLKLGVPSAIAIIFVLAIVQYAPTLAEGITKATTQHESIIKAQDYILNGDALKVRLLQRICINTSETQGESQFCL